MKKAVSLDERAKKFAHRYTMKMDEVFPTTDMVAAQCWKKGYRTALADLRRIRRRHPAPRRKR